MIRSVLRNAMGWGGGRGGVRGVGGGGVLGV